MSKQVPSRKVETITSNEDQVRFEIFSGALPISEAAAELLRVEKCQHEAERRRHRDSVERLSAEIAGMRDENKRMWEALAKVRGALENGALVPVDGYSDEIACLRMIDLALTNQQKAPVSKDTE